MGRSLLNPGKWYRGECSALFDFVLFDFALLDFVLVDGD